jgi:ligand-binding SRPBCC domain-containing protein
MSAHLEFSSWVPFPLEKVFLFFADPQNLPRIMPAKSETRIEALRLIAPPAGPVPRTREQTQSLAGAGSEIVTSFRLLPPLALRGQWMARITAFQWNEFFEDVQVRGLFQSWRHRHEVMSEARDGVSGTVVTDKIDYAFGLGPFDALLEPILSAQVGRTFRQRQQILPALLKDA